MKRLDKKKESRSQLQKIADNYTKALIEASSRKNDPEGKKIRISYKVSNKEKR